MKNQSGTIKTNLELDRVVMGGSGGYRRLPGGSDDFSLQTDKQTLHHNIYIIIVIIIIINIVIIIIIIISVSGFLLHSEYLPIQWNLQGYQDIIGKMKKRLYPLFDRNESSFAITR